MSLQYEGRVQDALTERAGAREHALSHETDVRGLPMGARGANCEARTRDTRGLESTPVADLFFAQENLDAVQEGIRWRVYVDSGRRHVISRQSDTEVKIVMRSLYLQHSENRPEGVLEQVQALNQRVLDYCVPQVLAEIEQYLAFQRDITQLPAPMERGANVHTKGSRVLELNRF